MPLPEKIKLKLSKSELIAFIDCLKGMSSIEPFRGDYTGRLILCLTIQVYKKYMAKGAFPQKLNRISLSPPEGIAVSLAIKLFTHYTSPGVYEQTVLTSIS